MWQSGCAEPRRVKLPDAIVAASALEAGVELLTFDRQLQSLMAAELTGQPMTPDTDNHTL